MIVEGDYVLFQNVLSGCSNSIRYKPLSNEVDYTEIPLFDRGTDFLVLPNDRKSDPCKWAKFCSEKYSKEKVFVVVPGTQFDASGTRHGHGNGWYDRFLSSVPSSWLRIGVVNESHFSYESISKQAWDEPVDWLVIKKTKDILIIVTKARSLNFEL